MPDAPTPPLRLRVRGALKSAFSVGHGFEPQPPNEHWSPDSVDEYPLDLAAKTKRAPRRYLNGRGAWIEPGPTTFAQAALGWSHRAARGDAVARQRLLALVDDLLARATVEGDLLVWRYSSPVPKYGVVAPWFSAMAQGQAASALVRAYRLSGDARHADGALAAIAGLRSTPGLVRSCRDGTSLEECPSEPPSTILNGWVYALWGVRDVAVALDDQQASELYSAAERGLRGALPRFDHAGWSRYSLYPPLAPDLAKPNYHRIHIDQLRVMQRITGAGTYAELADRWQRSDTLLRRARVLVGKAREVIGRA